MTVFTIDITVPNDKAQEVLEKLTNSFGYTGFDENNQAETRLNFLRRVIKQELRQRYRERLIQEAQAISSAQAGADADAVNIT